MAAEPGHWAFRPIQRPAAPAIDGGRNDVDRFILARLKDAGISPSPEADRATLLRRLSLDLLGLPPSPQQLNEFLNDARPDAYERLVDKLLASPHYGERWGRHWLDLARYADSDGYEKDTGRPYAWRFRNWVIAALNRDMPFDQFTIDQIAGDLLPKANLDQKIATGFHRNTLTNNEGGVDKEQFRVEATVDRTNTTATVWLGLTLGCAQCHDHKYDPFTQRDYYRLFAFFNSTTEANIAAPLPGEVDRGKQILARHQKELDAYRAKLPATVAAWEATFKPSDLPKLPENIRTIVKTPAPQRSDAQRKEFVAYFEKIDPMLTAMKKRHANELKTSQASLAQTIQDGPARKTHILKRGDFLRPGDEVSPGIPEALATVAPLRTANGPPTRIDLAKWLVSPQNPLTARVVANWVWSKYFGRGLVTTPEDFGKMGQKPSHPELLDWLASELMRRGWSLKQFHRLIVTSATYRQSSQARPELVERDPLNVLLSRQNRLRLEAEIVRDGALSASGLLNAAVGGPSIRPPQPPGISDLTYAGSAKWVESTGADRFRRGMYIWFQRTSPYPTLMTFDSPDSNVCAVRRERSNTPLQALTLMNDIAFVECAQALGRRLADQAGDDGARVAMAFRLCLGRNPVPSESARLTALVADVRDLYQSRPTEAAKLLGNPKAKIAEGKTIDYAAWTIVARAMLNLDEFVTRE
jgi:hypothetical protein